MADFQFRILTEDYGGSEKEMAMQGLAVIEAVIAINMAHFRRYPADMCASVRSLRGTRAHGPRSYQPASQLQVRDLGAQHGTKQQ